MGNPVFNRLENQWTGPAPAGAPGQAANPQYPYQTSPQQQQQPVYDQEAFQQAQQAYYGPSASAVDIGRMTIDDVIVKTALCLATLVGFGAVSWMLTASNPSLGTALMFGGLLVGFVLAMVNIFSKTIRPAMVLGYSAAEGLALGALSQVVESALPGVVIQAVLATVVVFSVTLALFASGKVRNSPKLMKFTLISLIGIIVSRLLIWLFGSFGWLGTGNTGFEISVAGITFPLPVLISVFAVLIGAFCLIGDFDQAKVGVQQGVPTKFAWACAFGIMVTVVWLYVELLRIFSYLNNR